MYELRVRTKHTDFPTTYEKGFFHGNNLIGAIFRPLSITRTGFYYTERTSTDNSRLANKEEIEAFEQGFHFLKYYKTRHKFNRLSVIHKRWLMKLKLDNFKKHEEEMVISVLRRNGYSDVAKDRLNNILKKMRDVQ